MTKIAQRSQKILIAGENHEIAKLFPMWGKGDGMYVWAEKGEVCWEDPRTNGFGSMLWHEAALRVNALSDMVISSSEDRRWDHERRVLQGFICQMEEVIRLAKEHNKPTGQEARNQKQRSRSITPRGISNIIVGDPTKGIPLR